MSYPRYDSYKESGVEWLGEIPSHWEPKRLRFWHTTNPSKSEVNHLDEETEVSFVPMEAVGEYGGLELDQIKPIESVLNGYTYFRDNDVVVAKITPCFENGKGAIAAGLINGIGFGTTELHVMRPSANVDSRFFFYLTISHSFRNLGEAEMYGAGGQKRVPERFIRNSVYALPPLGEQTAIADFLDRETAKIDALIAKQQALIDLLGEKRQALISHAVTKGLNPDVLMQTSEVEWLGEIPRHWKPKRLRFWHTTNPSKSEVSHLTKDTEVSFVPMEAVGEYGGMLLDQTKPIENVFNGYTYFQNDDVVVAKITPCFENGKGAIAKKLINGIGFGTTELHVMRPCANVESRFLLYLTISHSFRNLGEAEMYGAGGQKRVPERFIRDSVYALPPLDEQIAIANLLDRETAIMDVLIAKQQQQIQTLQERRTALISAAVTGKIIVR